MSESNSKRVVVWVQHFADRDYLMLQWHDPDTNKRKSRSAQTNNPVEAEKKRADLEYELNHGLYQEPARMTWERFRELFEAEYVAGLRPNTQRNHQDTLNLFEELCNPTSLRGISERTLSTFVAGMRKRKTRGREGLAPSSMAVRLEFLHTALSWAVGQKFLPFVPQFPAVRVPRKDPQPVATEAFERLLDQAPDANMRTYLLTGWLAGLRLEEAFLLEWEPTNAAPWVDLGNNRIVLPAELVKGVRDQWVPLDPELRQALEALPRHGQRVFEFIDTRKGRGGPVSAKAVSDRVSSLAKQAGVRLTMKSLRRGFGCRYAAKVPAQVLQKLMRHSRIKTTMDYYANVDEAAMEAVLGTGRNTSRNSSPVPAPEAPKAAGTDSTQPVAQEATSALSQRQR
jgi:integrase